VRFWAKELKLIYDYHPDLKVVFTGSSVLDFKKGSSDLSRRAVMYYMQGLSFREYLQIFHQISSSTYSLDEILEHKVELPELEHPLPLFEDYVKRGYRTRFFEHDTSVAVWFYVVLARKAQFLRYTLSENSHPENRDSLIFRKAKP
jgi:predicted AAA+ superfamily ATPase